MYLDNILIYSRSEEEHLALLKKVFSLLRVNKLYAKMKKCSFLQTSTEYLGHLVNQDGIRTDPKKTKAICDWPHPTDLHELQQFLGLANYYRCFVYHYSEITLPLTNLLKKEAPFIWNVEHQVAFDTLKDKLTLAPTLKLIDLDTPL